LANLLKFDNSGDSQEYISYFMKKVEDYIYNSGGQNIVNGQNNKPKTGSNLNFKKILKYGDVYLTS
jgi:hypothetical protein